MWSLGRFALAEHHSRAKSAMSSVTRRTQESICQVLCDPVNQKTLVRETRGHAVVVEVKRLVKPTAATAVSP
jgi:hypothetical protein